MSLGTVNGFVNSRAWFGSIQFDFDGTTRGLVRSAYAVGARAGDKLLANYGGRLKSNASQVTLVSAPHDDRAFGMWV